MADVETAPTTEPTETTEGPRRPLSLLARETYGSNFTGEVHEPEPVEAEESNEPEEHEEPQESEEVETESEDDPGPEPEAEGEEVPISSLRELIEHQEWDPEWVDALKVPVKVDGEPAEATLKDLVASYQMNAAADKRLEDAKAKAKALNQELTEKSEALQGQFATVAKLVGNAEKLLDSDTASIDWKHLREEDPAEYSAKKSEIAERRQEIENMKREAIEAWQQSTETQSESARGELQQRLQAEQEALLEKLPEWREPEKAKGEKAKLVGYLTSQGFSEQDVMGASDHRLILIARKAMLFDEGQTKVAAAKKRVAKVPKVLKPGAPKPHEQIEKEKVKKIESKFKQSGSIDDAFELLKAKRRN